MSENMMVLVVDPDEKLAEALTQAFVAAGFSSVAVATGQDALETADIEHCDFALIEADLPDMSGLQLVRHFIKRQPQIITTMMTADPSIPRGLSAIEAGVTRYLFKPFGGVSSVPPSVRELATEKEFHLRRLHSLSIIDAELGQERATPLDRPPIEVLIVEPDGATRGEVAATLERRGCVVTGAICGQEALEMLNELRFEVLIMAHDMGDMMANDMLGQVQQATPDVALIVISVQPTTDLIATLIRLGADDLVPDALEDHERITAAVLRHGQAARLRKSSASLEALVERAAKYTIAPPPAPANAPGPSPQTPAASRVASYEERLEATEAFEEGLKAFKDKQYDEAQVAWVRAVELHPTNRWYRWNLNKLKRIASKA